MILYFYAKLLFWLWVSYAGIFKVCFNGLDLFILLMQILILKQVHVIHTYISYCLVLNFEVSDLCIALTLTMLPGSADFWCLDAQFL